jgi:hypothetical protein
MALIGCINGHHHEGISHVRKERKLNTALMDGIDGGH